MLFKKVNGKIFDVKLTNSEQKAIDSEIMAQIADMNEQNSIELDATILWVLHRDFGFGEKRMLRFYTEYLKELRKLNERYRDENCESVYENTRKLAKYGINIHDLAVKSRTI